MNRTRLVIFFAFALLLTSQLACAPGAAGPAGMTPADAAAVPALAQGIALPPAILEQRFLKLEFPPVIRAGNSDVVRLTFELDDSGGLTPTLSLGGSTARGQGVSLPNVFDTHNVMAEARLDMAGVDIRPGEAISETLLPGQKVTFYWSLLPVDAGKYKGTVWFYLRFIPRAGGEESRRALSAQPIEIEASSLFGLKANLARWLGLGGALSGFVLAFPFLGEVFKRVTKRIRARP